MDKRFLTPGEVANATISIGIKKAGLKVSDCICLEYLQVFL